MIIIQRISAKSCFSKNKTLLKILYEETVLMSRTKLLTQINATVIKYFSVTKLTISLIPFSVTSFMIH